MMTTRLFHVRGLLGISTILSLVFAMTGSNLFWILLPLLISLVVSLMCILAAIVKDCRAFGTDYHRESLSWKIKSCIRVILYPALATLPILLGNSIKKRFEQDVTFQVLNDLIPIFYRIMILAYLFKHF